MLLLFAGVYGDWIASGMSSSPPIDYPEVPGLIDPPPWMYLLLFEGTLFF